MAEVTCGSCAHFEPEHVVTEQSWGDCRRYPPSAGPSGAGVWPVVWDYQRCGEHRPREAAESPETGEGREG